jgi:Zn-dependent M28 family amino/carboxypeptidase
VKALMQKTSIYVQLALIFSSIFAPTTPVASTSLHDAFNSQQAFAYTAEVAGFGERWPGSPGHKKTEDLIHQVLQKDGAQIEADNFVATTPRGPVPVHNIIGKFNVTSNPKQGIFILAGHYDTLFKPGFIGANDGASSTAILLAFADALAHQKTGMQIWLVWTDLEEAVNIGDFGGDDGLYGSKHLAKKLAASGNISRIRGFLLLDMIGDKDLNVARETGSNSTLQFFIARAANQLGYSNYFFKYDANIIDDQVPFIQVGIPSVDVVDAEYGRMGPGFDDMGEFHHTNADTMDKVSQHSLEVVGRTILLTVELLDRQD